MSSYTKAKGGAGSAPAPPAAPAPTTTAPAPSGGAAPPSGGALSYAQLEGLWVQAGGDPSVAPTMAAIALAESSGNPTSANLTDSNGQGGSQSSFGLWQISTGTHDPPDPNWMDPLTNAKLAVGKYNAGGFHPWGTWTTGAYRQYMQDGVAPDLNAAQEAATASAAGGAVGAGTAAPSVGGQQYDPKTVYPDDPKLDQSIATEFPNFAWMMSDPQIANILRFAAKSGANATWVQAEVQNTDWWKKNSDSIKQWQTLQQTDPAEALQQMHNRAAQIAQQAGTVGLTVGPDRANQLAQEALQYNWNDQQLQQALYAEAQRAMGATAQQQSTNESQIGATGTAQSYAEQAVQAAQQYLVSLNPETAQQLGFKIATGQMDPSALQSMFIGQAKARFADNPQLLKALDSGITPAQVLGPYQQTISNLLEISPDQVNFTDPKYGQVLSSRRGDGTMGLMTESEAATWARSQPEWQQTQNYRDTANQTAQQVLTSLGAVK